MSKDEIINGLKDKNQKKFVKAIDYLKTIKDNLDDITSLTIKYDADLIPLLNKFPNLYSLYIEPNEEQIMDLTQMPRFENLKILSIRSGNLKALGKCLENFPNLEYLRIDPTEEQTLDLTQVPKLEYLKSLSIGAGKVKALGKCFENFPNLENISLHCEFEESDFTAFATLKNLTKLYLGHGCKFANLPKQIAKSTSLQELSIQFVTLQETDFPVLATNTSIKSLTISDNNLSSIPQDLGKMKNLEELDIFGNDLSNADLRPLSNLKNLKKVSIGDFGDFFPVFLKELPALESLSLVGNTLGKKAFEGLADLKNLKYINLYRSKIIPPSLEKLEKLEEIQIYENKFLDPVIRKLDAKGVKIDCEG